MVPRERLELSLLSKTDFESAASTDSATEARWARSIGRRPGVVNRAEAARQALREPSGLSGFPPAVALIQGAEGAAVARSRGLSVMLGEAGYRWGKFGCVESFAVGWSV